MGEGAEQEFTVIYRFHPPKLFVPSGEMNNVVCRAVIILIEFQVPHGSQQSKQYHALGSGQAWWKCHEPEVVPLPSVVQPGLDFLVKVQCLCHSGSAERSQILARGDLQCILGTVVSIMIDTDE